MNHHTIKTTIPDRSRKLPLARANGDEITVKQEPHPQSYGNPARVGGVVQRRGSDQERREGEIGGRVWICDDQQQGGGESYFWRGFMCLDTPSNLEGGGIVKSICIVAN